jgi:hypothetical protein
VIAHFGVPKNTDYTRVQFLAVMAILLALCMLAGYLVKNRIDGILIDDRNRISLSRFQWVLWFILLLGAYYTESIWNIANNFGFPIIQPQLLALLGIASGSAVVAGLITDSKKATPTPAAPPPENKALPASTTLRSTTPPPPIASTGAPVGSMAVNKAPEDASWSNLYLGDEVANDGVVDTGRLQSLVITVLLVVIYFSYLWKALIKAGDKGLEMPMVDGDANGFLWLLGLSHGAYLASKAVPKQPATTTK